MFLDKEFSVYITRSMNQYDIYSSMSRIQLDFIRLQHDVIISVS